MLEFDSILLARIQFAFTISFHIIFPAFTIGLASFLTVLECCWLKTSNTIFRDIYQFWVKIFAVAFGMGVVSGVVMSYQFGTNWSVFADRVASVIGPLLGFEVLTAFFLEASFLGIMLFGWGRVSSRMHFFATFIVSVGTLISAFWILAANSWMQTPQGFEMAEDGRLIPVSWLQIIFNPSFPYRFMHMVMAAYLTTAFIVGGVGAFYLWHRRHIAHARVMLGMAVLMVVLAAPLQILLGDMHGLNTLKHQPAKVSAMEGLWDTERGAAFRLFAVSDQKLAKNHYEVKLPYLTSLILTHSVEGEVKGLKEWAEEDRPPVLPVFFAFRIMVGIGMMMMLTGLISVVCYFRNKFFENKLIQLLWMTMVPSGFIALLSGWFVTEIGRQPYIVYGVLRTAESVSPAILGPQVLWSLTAFIFVYIFVFGAGSYYILKLIAKGIPASKEEGSCYKYGIETTAVKLAVEEGGRDHA